jgi:hypothetical protein
MLPEKYGQIVDRLVARTSRREIEWRETAHPEQFQVSFPNYSLTLQQRTRRDGSVDYIISIINASGTTVDTFTDEQVDATVGGKYFQAMGELFEQARRQALGADEALDQVLKELGSTSTG